MKAVSSPSALSTRRIGQTPALLINDINARVAVEQSCCKLADRSYGGKIADDQVDGIVWHRRPNCLNGRFAFVATAADHHDMTAALRQLLDNRRADSGIAAGYDKHIAGKIAWLHELHAPGSVATLQENYSEEYSRISF